MHDNDNDSGDAKIVSLWGKRQQVLVESRLDLTAAAEGLLADINSGKIQTLVYVAETHDGSHKVEIAGELDEDGRILLDAPGVIWSVEQIKHLLLVSSMSME